MKRLSKLYWPLAFIMAVHVGVCLAVPGVTRRVYLIFAVFDLVYGLFIHFNDKRHQVWLRELAELREGVRRRQEALRDGEGMR